MTVPLIMARPLPGTVGETRRVVHLFPFLSSGITPEQMTAYCGETFGPGELELLDRRPTGMPCVICLSQSPGPDDAQPPASER
jgi:hypothetical protein